MKGHTNTLKFKQSEKHCCIFKINFHIRSIGNYCKAYLLDYLKVLAILRRFLQSGFEVRRKSNIFSLSVCSPGDGGTLWSLVPGPFWRYPIRINGPVQSPVIGSAQGVPPVLGWECPTWDKGTSSLE